MNKKFTFGVAFLAVMSIAFFGAGCNPFQAAKEKAEEKVAEKMTEGFLEKLGGDNVDVDIDGDSATVNIKDDEGGGEMMFGDEVELPSDLEEGVIIYSDAVPKSVIRNLGGSKGAMVTLASKDKMKDIADWYEKEYVDAGWTKSQTVTINDAEMRGFEKGNEQVLVTVGPNEEEGGSMISINWSAE